jgi:hypothetical protein
MGLFDLFKKPLPVARDAWQVYAYTFGEGMRAIIAFDTTADTVKHAGYGACRRVILYVPREQVRGDAPSPPPGPSAARRAAGPAGRRTGEGRACRAGSWAG